MIKTETVYSTDRGCLCHSIIGLSKGGASINEMANARKCFAQLAHQAKAASMT